MTDLTSIPQKKPVALIHCSFCGKNQKEITMLIAGPVAFICDECVESCVTLLMENMRKKKEKAILLKPEQPAAQAG